MNRKLHNTHTFIRNKKSVILIKGMSEPVPVLHYSFDSYVSGTTVPNDGSSGSALNGTLTTLGTGSATIVSSNAAVGTKCLSLIGGSTSNGGHISVPAFTFGGAGWSVCFWYKKDASTKNESAARVFDFGVAPGNNGFGLFFSASSGAFVYYQNDSNWSPMPITINTANCVDGTWRHVAFVFDTTVSKYLCYFNGVLYSSFSGNTIVNASRTSNSIGRSLWWWMLYRLSC